MDGGVGGPRGELGRTASPRSPERPEATAPAGRAAPRPAAELCQPLLLTVHLRCRLLSPWAGSGEEVEALSLQPDAGPSCTPVCPLWSRRQAWQSLQVFQAASLSLFIRVRMAVVATSPFKGPGVHTTLQRLAVKGKNKD